MSLSSLQLDQTGNFDLLYNFFYVRNYAGLETYESYNLPFTPLHFEPNLSDGIEDFVSNKRLVWDFGDGTTTEAVTASHVYEKPGRYKVSCYLYDRAGTGYYDTFHAKVDIKDFITDRLEVTTTSDIDTYTGVLQSPITVNRYNSSRTIKSGTPTIFAYASGQTGDHDYFRTELSTETYGHLKPYTSFVQTLTTNGVVENVDVDTITTDDTNIYVKLSGNEIVYTTVEDIDAVFAGVSGTATTYFKSDLVDRFNLLFGFEQGSIFEFANTTNYGLSADVKANNNYTYLSFSSNGIDGEGSNEFNGFNISKEKFANTKIAFVVKVKDVYNFTQKNMPLLSANGGPALDLYLTDGTTSYDAEFTSNFQELSTETTGGYYKGYFTTNNTTTLTDVYLSAYTDGLYNVHGVSNTFTINPSSYYTVAKQNEDIDFEAAFKDVAVQPLFSDAKVLMKDFIGSIFGDLSSNQDSVGKATYEKIQNFFDNNSSLDHSNVEQLDGMLQLLDLPELTKYSLPPKLTRLMDLLSIGKSRLFGRRNRDNTQYESYGYRNNEFYGYNLGENLTADSYIVAGDPIVAAEKYSGQYTTLNTTLPLSARTSPVIEVTDGYVYTTSSGTLLSSVSVELGGSVEITLEQLSNCPILTQDSLSLITNALSSTSDVYRLSDYNSTWGWPLVEGGGRSITDIYSFYYQTSSVGDINDSIINFNDSNNTLSYNITSYNDWAGNNGIMSNIFANSLYEGLNLFDN
tara:strand:+ start:1832 stop:4057 length:2226 start_codon:yes stop_codon:yes gene_type:complete